MDIKFSDVKVGKSFIFDGNTYVKTKEVVISKNDGYVDLVNCVNTNGGGFEFMLGIQPVRIGDDK